MNEPKPTVSHYESPSSLRGFRRGFGLGFLTAALLAFFGIVMSTVFLGWPWVPGLPCPSLDKGAQPLVVPLAVTPRSQTSNAPVGRTDSSSPVRLQAYPLPILRQAFRDSRPHWINCLKTAKELQGTTLSLTLRWTPNAQLDSLKTRPETNAETHDCLATVVRGWKLPAHPTLQPFEWRVALAF